MRKSKEAVLAWFVGVMLVSYLVWVFMVYLGLAGLDLLKILPFYN